MSNGYGYVIGCGYMGWIPWLRQYMLFPTENEYLEYIKEAE